MSSKSSEEFVKLFAEEMFICVLRDSNVPWNPIWGFQEETQEVLPDLNVCRGLISESVSIASRRFRPVVMDEGSYVWDGVINSSDMGLLLPSLITVGDKLGKLNDSFFIFMAIVKDLCIRFHRAGQSYLFVHVLKAVVYVMQDMTVSTPELLRRKALDFLEEMAKENS